jgi:hypothetical protein
MYTLETKYRQSLLPVHFRFEAAFNPLVRGAHSTTSEEMTASKTSSNGTNSDEEGSCHGS